MSLLIFSLSFDMYGTASSLIYKKIFSKDISSYWDREPAYDDDDNEII